MRNFKRKNDCMARMSHDLRREKIIQAAMRVFSEKGFDKASIKDIAKSANMSPALLYAYFDSKDTLYKTVLSSTEEDATPIISEMRRLGAGSKALMLFVYDTLSSTLFSYSHQEKENQQTFDRLFCQSLIGNPEYAKSHHNELERNFITDFTLECFRVGEEAGELIKTNETPKFRLQMVMQLMLSFKLVFLSGSPIYNYEVSRQELLEKAALFCLRGIGFTQEAIQKHFDVQALSETLNRIHAPKNMSVDKS